jgi:hypothetical protein
MHFKKKKINSPTKLTIQPSRKKRKKKILADKDGGSPYSRGRKTEEGNISSLIHPSSRKRNRNKKKKEQQKKSFRKSSPKITRSNYDSRKYKSLSKWKNLFEGQPVFILGNSPSIGKQDLSLLNSYCTIGINRIFYIYDPTILIWQDKQVWRGDQDWILKSNAIRVCRDIIDSQKMFINYKLGFNPPKFSVVPNKMYGRGNSAILAAQLAVSIGCSDIVLLGTDCKYGKHRKTNFYGRNKDHTGYTLKMCDDGMKWLRKKSPVPIYNCSRNGTWEKRKLEDVIEELKPKKFKREYFRKLFIR